MRDILQKVSYLKGLAEGLKINADSDEGKVLLETINLLEELALAVDDLDYSQELIIEDIDEIDEDLADLEDYVYDFDLNKYDDFSDLDDFDFDDYLDETVEDSENDQQIEEPNSDINL